MSESLLIYNSLRVRLTPGADSEVKVCLLCQDTLFQLRHDAAFAFLR